MLVPLHMKHTKAVLCSSTESLLLLCFESGFCGQEA